jgi:cell filamentation protein
MLDKYGTGQDPYCYRGTRTLRNLLDITDETVLNHAERDISASAANEIEYCTPPYDLAALQKIHRQLFDELYDWAGEIRTIDISKDTTRLCTVSRIEPEASKLLNACAHRSWFIGLDREALIVAVAELFGDLNMTHPFREGNGRAQRILFEHLIIHAGFEISWWGVEQREWIQANIDAVVCDYSTLERVFERCIGRPIPS